MYILASALQDLPVISLQTGENIAIAREPVVDPQTLSIMAMVCELTKRGAKKILMMRDARQVAQDCLIVNSEDELTEPEDVVRLQPLLTNRFNPISRGVVTDLGRKLGVIEDYTINLDTMELQKLYIRQSIFRSWLGGSLIIDRSQIVDVTGRQIVVRDTTVVAPILPAEQAPDSPA